MLASSGLERTGSRSAVDAVLPLLRSLYLTYVRAC
jgi:hypothetical protein